MGELHLAETKLTFFILFYLTFIYPGKSIENNFSFATTTCHIHTVPHSYLEAAQYNHSLICWPLSSSTGAVGVKGLAQGHLSGGNEGGTSAVLSLSPPRFYPVGLGIEPTTSRSQARFPNL